MDHSESGIDRIVVRSAPYKMLQRGHSDLAEIFRWAENAMNINLGNYHKTLAEIRLRKTDRNKFLSLLQHHFNQYLEDSDV